MQRLHERPVTDFFRHDATSWMELVHRLDARTRGPPSGSPLISMVQPTHDRKSDHLVVCILSGRIRSALFWNLLSNPLMRPCPVEGGHIGIEHALELPLMQDQQVVQAFLPNTPQKAFADGVGAFRMNRRFEDLDGARFRYTSKTRPELALVITDQVLRGLSIRGGFSQVLRHPGIGRGSWDSDMDHSSCFERGC